MHQKTDVNQIIGYYLVFFSKLITEYQGFITEKDYQQITVSSRLIARQGNHYQQKQFYLILCILSTELMSQPNSHAYDALVRHYKHHLAPKACEELDAKMQSDEFNLEQELGLTSCYSR